MERKTQYLLLLLFGFLIPILFGTNYYVDADIPPTNSFSIINANDTDVTSNTYRDTLYFTSDDSILFNATNGNPTLVNGTSYINLEGYDYRKKITVNNSQVSGSTPHINFPLLVSLTNDSDLKSTNVQSLGQDIRFTSSDGMTLLNYEIESFVNDSTNGNLISWVSIPSLSANTDTILYMYYSNPDVLDAQNPSELWDDSYKAVYHLNDSFEDSTINAQHLTHFGSTSTPVKIEDGQDYGGTTTHYEIRNPFTGFPSTEITAEFWMSSTGNTDGILSYAISGSTNAFLLFDQSSLRLLIVSTTHYTGVDINDGNLHHIVVQWRSSDGAVFVYVDGVLAYYTTGYRTGISISDGGSFVIGQDQDTVGGGFAGNQAYNGLLDEIRLSDDIKSADWIYTTYNTQNDPSSFYNITNQESNITISQTIEYQPNIIDFSINTPNSTRLGGVFSQVCTGNQFMTGINNDGNILCASLP